MQVSHRSTYFCVIVFKNSSSDHLDKMVLQACLASWSELNLLPRSAFLKAENSQKSQGVKLGE